MYLIGKKFHFTNLMRNWVVVGSLAESFFLHQVIHSEWSGKLGSEVCYCSSKSIRVSEWMRKLRNLGWSHVGFNLWCQECQKSVSRKAFHSINILQFTQILASLLSLSLQLPQRANAIIHLNEEFVSFALQSTHANLHEIETWQHLSFSYFMD